MLGPHFSSPLTPVQQVLPTRRMLPRSKREPDLHRTAITARIRQTPHSQHPLRRDLISVFAATQALEQIVTSQAKQESV